MSDSDGSNNDSSNTNSSNTNSPNNDRANNDGISEWDGPMVSRDQVGQSYSAAQAASASQSNSSGPDQQSWQLIQNLVLETVKEQKRARRWRIFFRCLTFLLIFAVFFTMAKSGGKAALEKGISASHVAKVDIKGVIADQEMANASDINKGLQMAFKSPSVKAIVLDINSPGGSPVQSGYVYDEIKRLRQLHPEKKVYAVISDIGASGAYYIAAAADEIYADKASVVGSIGVISASFGYTGLLEKLGVERRVFSAGDNKAMLDEFSPLSESHVEHWQKVLATTHTQFIEQVKLGRGDRLSSDSEIFSGLMWTGEQAVDKGLVDGLGSLAYVARDIVGESKIVDYTVDDSRFGRLIRGLGVDSLSSVFNAVRTGQIQLIY